MDETTPHLTPALGVVATDDKDVGRHTQVAQGAVESHRLLGLVIDLRLDDKEADVGMSACLATGVRPEQDHARIRGSRS